MKKILFVFTIFFAATACDSHTSEQNTNDGVGKTNPSAIDTTQHATGITNQNVISTDTAAMNVENVTKDSTGKKH